VKFRFRENLKTKKRFREPKILGTFELEKGKENNKLSQPKKNKEKIWLLRALP
jgi:hypothetical protein